jgi:hypothetical protein
MLFYLIHVAFLFYLINQHSRHIFSLLKKIDFHGLFFRFLNHPQDLIFLFRINYGILSLIIPFTPFLKLIIYFILSKL